MGLKLKSLIKATGNTTICGSNASGWGHKAVQYFLNRGGLNVTDWPDSPDQLHHFLLRLGYVYIGALMNTGSQQVFTKKSAQPGDVVIQQVPWDPARWNVCLWNGRYWCSDAVQWYMSIYTEEGDVPAYVYRWAGEVVEEDMENKKGNTVELDTSILSTGIPGDVKFRNLWMRYQLRMGPLRSPWVKKSIKSK